MGTLFPTFDRIGKHRLGHDSALGCNLGDKAQTPGEFVVALDSIFSRLTPAMEFYKQSGSGKKTKRQRIQSSNGASTQNPEPIPRVAIAAIHTGCNPQSAQASNTTKVMNIYHSRRDSDGIIFQYLPVDSLRGKTVIFSAKAKLKPRILQQWAAFGYITRHLHKWQTKVPFFQEIFTAQAGTHFR
jgi:hypothetical protein